MKFGLALCVLSTAGSIFGQLATITGTIVDSSGAVVVDAPVEVRNQGTGQFVRVASTASGNYTVGQLPIGDYDIVVTVAGFKTYNHNGFHLSAQQTMREDVVLEVGAAVESVTVSSEASLLKTESSELVHNVTVSQMDNLPVLPVGSTGAGFRDPFALVRMLPGTSYTAGTTMVVNGNPNNSVQIRVEGQTFGNQGSLKSFTQQTQPSADAVQEVAVQTSNYAAEFGTAGGAVLNTVMKSGTNQYHGSAYDYAINEALNAHTPYTGLRNRQRRHDWGFTAGGPVKIPKLYNGTNRTFFFFSFEQYRERTVITSTTPTVPIPQYRIGDFSPLIAAENNRTVKVGTADYKDPLGNPMLSGMLFDPNSTQTAPSGSGTVRTQFPGNIVPANRFDPVSSSILKLVPLPTGPNASKGQFGANYQVPWVSRRISQIPSVKIDQNIGSKGHLSGYWQNTGTTSAFALTPGGGGPEGFPIPITADVGTFVYAKADRINYDYTLSPTLLLHLGAGWNSLKFDNSAPVLDYNAEKELGLRGATLNRTFPVITTATSTTDGGLNPLGPASQTTSYERRPAGNASLSWVRGNHTYKVGAEYRIEKYPSYNFTNTSGSYSFSTAATLQTSLQGQNITQGINGFAFASFLLGGVTGATLAQPLASSTSKTETSVFLQDNWKVTRRLTLDYGLRWDYGTYAKEQYGRNGNFALNVPNPSAGGHPGGQIYEATCGCNFASNYPFAIGPRLGGAYQINHKTVLRAGFGIVYNSTGTSGGSSSNSANAGTPGFGQTIGRFQDGIPSSVQPIWPNFNVNAGQSDGTVVAAPTLLDVNAGRPARQYQWSVGLQREINRNLVVEASYVANRGVWWPAALSAVNALQISDLNRLGFTDFTSSSESLLLTTSISALSAGQRATLASRGIVLPYSSFPTAQTVRQSIMPFPQYTGLISPAQAPLGKTWYDGLQVNVTQRFSHGISLNANYTYSKNLDLMSAVDIFNRSDGKDISANDLPHQFRLTAEYTVPTLAKSGMKMFSNKTVSYILSGWGMAWYLQYQSAPLLARPASQGSVPLSNFLGRGPGSAQLKVDSDGQLMNPWSIDWYDNSGNHRTDPINVNCHCFDPTKTDVLNPAAWVSIPNGQWASDLSTIRSFRGLRMPQENLNLSRNFRFGEHVQLNVRGEFTNIFNRTRLPQPSTTGNFGAAPTVFPTGANTGLYSSGFGTIVPTSGTAGARAGTLVGRLTF